jgi:hypothetical protein
VAQSGRARTALGPALIGVGGALMVVGSAITWVRYSFAQETLALLSQSRLGVASGAGRITIACGAVVLGIVPVMIAGNPAWRRGVAVAAVALGLGAALLALTNLLTKDAQVYDGIRTAIGETTGHPVTDAEFARLKTQLQATGFTVSAGPGIYLVIAGGLLVTCGGLADLAGGEEEDAGLQIGDLADTPAPAPAPAPRPGDGDDTPSETAPPGTR